MSKWGFFVLGFLLVLPYSGQAAVCLWVSSYHTGYPWNDGIEKGLTQSLEGACELKKFFMDTKRHPDSSHASLKATEALELIERLQPDIVIASDDNASAFLVAPHLKGSKIPVVFCGVNWSVEAYGYPAPNITGMVEVTPVSAMIDGLRKTLPTARRGVYLSSDVPTEKIEFTHIARKMASEGINLKAHFVKNWAQWKEGVRVGQNFDFIIFGNYNGIQGWDGHKGQQVLQHKNKRLTLGHYQWMLPYVMLVFSKDSVEQGQWAGDVAKAILSGRRASEIPISPNRKSHLYYNPQLLKSAGFNSEHDLLLKATPLEADE